MKKERIVVICVCAVLLGTLYTQWIAWACHIGMPSAGSSAYVMEFASAGWPPLGFVYTEVCRRYGEPGRLEAQQSNESDAAQRVARRALQSGVK